jgi:hypothetical protein
MMSHWTRLSHQELACGKSLLDLSVYRGVALWWFNQMEVFEAFRQVITDQAGPTATRFGMIGNPSRSNALSTMQSTAIQIGLGGVCGCANRLNASNHHSEGMKGPVLLITHDAEWRPIFDANKNVTIVTDRFFYPLAEELRQRGFEICSSSLAIPPYLRSLRLSSERFKTGFSRHYLIDGFSNCEGVFSRTEAIGHFGKIVKTIENDTGLERMLVEFGEKRAGRLKEILIFSFLKRFPDFVKRMDQAELMLQRVMPSTVIIENESGFFQRAVIATAQRRDVPTIALQHGEISLFNPAYNFLPEDICDKRQSATCVPIPDLTLVYGPHYADLLTHKSAFPAQRVISVGNMQFDSIAKIDKERAAKQVRKDLSIGPEERLVLWTTQVHSWAREEFEATTIAVAKALSELPRAQLIVKQHPMETRGQKEELQRHLQPLGQRVVFAPKERDIMVLILSADVVITKDSTTGLEAVAAKKPLIVLNLSGVEDKVDYAKEGAAVGIYRASDLRAAIDNAFADGSNSEGRHQGYVKRYLLELDGKAAKRVADLVESFSEGSTGGRSPGV